MTDDAWYGLAAGAAGVTAAVLLYAGWLAWQAGHRNLALSRASLGAWMATYTVSLIAWATDSPLLGWMVEPWVIWLRITVLAVAVALAVPDWREVR